MPKHLFPGYRTATSTNEISADQNEPEVEDEGN
jgi:hypothetical protein